MSRACVPNAPGWKRKPRKQTFWQFSTFGAKIPLRLSFPLNLALRLNLLFLLRLAKFDDRSDFGSRRKYLSGLFILNITTNFTPTMCGSNFAPCLRSNIEMIIFRWLSAPSSPWRFLRVFYKEGMRYVKRVKLYPTSWEIFLNSIRTVCTFKITFSFHIRRSHKPGLHTMFLSLSLSDNSYCVYYLCRALSIFESACRGPRINFPLCASRIVRPPLIRLSLPLSLSLSRGEIPRSKYQCASAFIRICRWKFRQSNGKLYATKSR